MTAKKPPSRKPSRARPRAASGEPAKTRAPATRRPRSKPGTERARDEQRAEHGPQYAGSGWQLADERGDRRFGHARTDDADPSELAPGAAANDDDESPSAADPELAAAEQAGEIESGGQRAGMRRGEKPRKAKRRER